MITCECGKKFTKCSEFLDVRSLGLFALFGTCPKCGLRQPVESLFRRIKVVKGIDPELAILDRKHKKSKKRVSESLTN